MGATLKRESYEAAIAHMRAHPNDIAGAAIASGLHRDTVSWIRSGPARPRWPWAVPLSVLLAREVAAEEEARDAADAQTAATERKQAEQLRAMRNEAGRITEQARHLTRINWQQSAAMAASMHKGVAAMVRRACLMLESGLDDAGKALALSPEEALKLADLYVRILRRTAAIGESVTVLERLLSGDAVEVVGVGAQTIEEAQANIDLCQRALDRAKARGDFEVDASGKRKLDS